MSSEHKSSDFDGQYVPRELCEAIHVEQREANTRTWDEIRMLRRLVIMLVVGGQLFTGGLNLAGMGYWLQQHAAQPHPATIQMIETLRTETRDELKELRREIHELTASVQRRSTPSPMAGQPNVGKTQ